MDREVIDEYMIKRDSKMLNRQVFIVKKSFFQLTLSLKNFLIKC